MFNQGLRLLIGKYAVEIADRPDIVRRTSNYGVQIIAFFPWILTLYSTPGFAIPVFNECIIRPR